MSWKHSLWRALAAVKSAAAPPAPAPGLRVLAYHSIGTELPGDPYGLSVSREAFARQMERLASGAFGKPASFGSADLGSREPLIAVTFDDGYEDTLRAAAPVLERIRLPFTVFVTPGLLDAGRPHMSWAELRELAALPGAEIGAHGLTHARLDALDDAALARELTESRRRLEDALGKPVELMSWPHGAASRRARDAAAHAGFARAACSLYGVNDAARDPLLLRRVEITGFDTEADFAGKALGSWDWFAWRQPDPARR